MLLETYVFTKLRQAHEKYKKEEYNDDEARQRNSNAMLALAIIWLFMMVMWILSIIWAAQCPKPNGGEVLLAIFFWPLFLILKATGTMCRGNKK